MSESFNDRFDFLAQEEAISDYFEYLRDYFAHHIVKDIPRTSRIARIMMSELELTLSKRGVAFKDGKNTKDSPRRYGSVKDQENHDTLSERDWSAFQNYLSKAVQEEKTDPYVSRNIDIIINRFSLKPHMKWVILFMRTLNENYILGEAVKEIVYNNPNRYGLLISRIIPNLTPEERKDIVNAFLPKSDLIQKGLVEFSERETDDDGDVVNSFPHINAELQELIVDPELTIEKINRQVLGEPTVIPELSIDHFPHLDDQVKKILGIVKGAIASGEKGINILLYGPAGSGKTALAAAISKALELEMYTIGEQNPDEDGDKEYKNGSGTSKYRISKLQQAHALLKDNNKAVLFFDEIEDTLNKGTDSSKKPDVFSKILLNRLLETNPIVTIWAGNDLEKFHESVLQRFSYSLPVTYPPTLMRLEIWKTQVLKNKIELSDADLLQLARDFVAPPRIIGKALQNARLTGNTDVKSIIHFIEQASLIAYGGEDKLRLNSGLSRYFSRDLLPQDLKGKIDSWIDGAGKKSPVSIYIDAVRGAGVNAMAEDIAERLIMHPNIVDAGALSTDSMVMSAINKIKMVFNNAARGNQLLIIQNIEAFNENPDNPQDKWRNDLVGQFARSLSEHDLPVVVSSMKDGVTLPPTLAPLFTIKDKMGALNAGQLKQASQIYFGFEWPHDVKAKEGIVPGDFSLVRKIIEKLPAEPSKEEIIGMVMTQAQARSGLVSGQKVGF